MLEYTIQEDVKLEDRSIWDCVGEGILEESILKDVILEETVMAGERLVNTEMDTMHKMHNVLVKTDIKKEQSESEQKEWDRKKHAMERNQEEMT